MGGEVRGGLPPGLFPPSPPARCPMKPSNRQQRIQGDPLGRLPDGEYRGVGKGLHL